MNTKNLNKDKYYTTEVDTLPRSIYCYHDVMGELLIPMHSHEKAQLLYTEGGIIHIQTPDNMYYLPPRHVMWIPAGMPHSIHTSTKNAVMRNLYFPTDADEIEFYNKVGIYLTNQLLLQLIMFSDKWRGDIKQDSRDYSVALAIKHILPDVCESAVPLSLPYPNNERLKKVINHMANNLEEQLSYKKLASKFGFSERSLNRLFQKETGMSFIKYFTIQKMLRAIELLLDNTYSISEVAFAVGYNSAPTFSNTFYKLLGQRPSDYLVSK